MHGGYKSILTFAGVNLQYVWIPLCKTQEVQYYPMNDVTTWQVWIHLMWRRNSFSRSFADIGKSRIVCILLKIAGGMRTDTTRNVLGWHSYSHRWRILACLFCDFWEVNHAFFEQSLKKSSGFKPPLCVDSASLSPDFAIVLDQKKDIISTNEIQYLFWKHLYLFWKSLTFPKIAF